MQHACCLDFEVLTRVIAFQQNRYHCLHFTNGDPKLPGPRGGLTVHHCHQFFFFQFLLIYFCYRLFLLSPPDTLLPILSSPSALLSVSIGYAYMHISYPSPQVPSSKVCQSEPYPFLCLWVYFVHQLILLIIVHK
uniref:Uncharacterized protein n=1 Tax=Molossus molossus TaxID=27622 RepID=A0A7J8CZE1_MOLMO|nr:hypothetical protein HJG59_009515 [Molossus molossus]